MMYFKRKILAIFVAVTTVMTMAFPLVAFAAITEKDSISCTGTTNCTTTHMNNVANGDLLVGACAVNNSGAGRVTLSDSASNTYVSAGSYQNASAPPLDVETFYVLNATVNNGTTFTATAQTGDLIACSWTDIGGVATTNALDRKAGSNGVGTAVNSGSTATTQMANEILIGVNGQANNRAWTTGTGYTSITSTGNGTAAGIQLQYKIVSATGAYDEAGTALDISSDWVGSLYTFSDTPIVVATANKPVFTLKAPLTIKGGLTIK